MVGKAVLEMYADGEICELPSEFISVVMRGGMLPELLWRVSWALNGIGHNIVELSVFDWLAAIRRQRNEMYVPPPPPQMNLLWSVGVVLNCVMLLLLFFFNAALQRGSYHPVSRTLVT